MDTTNYQELVKGAEKVEMLIEVEPAATRKFFIDTDHSVINEKIGESLFIELFF